MKTKITITFAFVVGLLMTHAGSFDGVGIVLMKKDAMTRVAQVLEQSPAAKAGIQKDWCVISIDGVATRNKTLSECVGLIRGPAGTKITLELTDLDHTKTNKVTLTRGKIQLDSPGQGQNGPVKIGTNVP